MRKLLQEADTGQPICALMDSSTFHVKPDDERQQVAVQLVDRRLSGVPTVWG